MRLVAMGSAPLVEGFALLGFETFPDATPQDVERLLSGMLRERERALVLLEQKLAEDGPALEQVRREGGSILVTEIPALGSPESYRSPVEELVLKVLGPGALEERS
jgi:vacuolar-type H+-ATPase subunit F/Vma7